MAKQIAWTGQAKADVRAIGQRTAMRIPHGWRGSHKPRRATSNAFRTSNRRSFACAWVPTAFASTITAIPSRFSPSSTAQRPTVEEGRIRAYNPSVNSRLACSRLALQIRDLDARKSDYRVNWGDSGGTAIGFEKHGECLGTCPKRSRIAYWPQTLKIWPNTRNVLDVGQFACHIGFEGCTV